MQPASTDAESPLIVYTNAWGLDFTRDWHCPVMHRAWRTVEREWLRWLRATCLSPLDPPPRFPLAWVTGPLGRGRGACRFSGVLLPRRDRLNRPSYVAAAVQHDPGWASGPIWRALQARLGEWATVAWQQGRHAPDPETAQAVARELVAEPVLRHAAVPVAAAAEAARQRLDAAGHGWQEMLAALERERPPVEFATRDGSRLWRVTADGDQLGPVDACDLWTLYHGTLARTARRRMRRAAFTSLSTVHTARPRGLTAVARWVTVAEPAATAVPAAVPSRPNPQVVAAERQAIARTLRERRRRQTRQQTVQVAAGLLLAVGLLAGLLALVASHADSGDGHAGPAAAPAFVPDADAPPGERLAQRMRHAADAHGGRDTWQRLLRRLTAAAEAQREPGLAAFLRAAGDALARGTATAWPTVPPVDEAVLTRWFASEPVWQAARRAAGDAAADTGAGAAEGRERREPEREHYVEQVPPLADALRDALPDYAALLADSATGAEFSRQ